MNNARADKTGPGNGQTDRDRIVTTVQNYLDGMVFADIDKLRSALHPRWFCIGHFAGGLEWDSFDAFLAGVEANAEPPEDGVYYFEVISIDVTGDIAAVKVVNDYLGMRFTDYLTLLCVDGRWLIVNKVFHHHR